MPEPIDLRVLLDGARAAVIATDCDYRVRYLNAAAEERLNARSRDAVGQPISLWVAGEYNTTLIRRRAGAAGGTRRLGVYGDGGQAWSV
jgi:PAS domain-containing protein